MIIQEKSDKKYIVLDENESVGLVASGKRQTTGISVTNKDGRMDVVPDPEAVNVVREGKLDIFEKCDKWFETFTKVHDMFRELALSDRCKRRNINMKVNVSVYVNVKKDNDMGKCIDLDLKLYRDVIQEGPSLEIPSENEDVFKYMLARVLEYYLIKNYGDKEVELPDIWSFSLESADNVEYEEVYPIEFSMGILKELPEYRELIKKIIYKYNLGLPIKPMIEELKSKITDSEPIERINESVSYSERQLKNISGGKCF